MPSQVKIFSGYLNTDDSQSQVPMSHHTMAKNGVFRGNDGNKRFQSIPGTRTIVNSLPAGNNECIGSFYDGLRQRIIWFNWNSNGRNGIYQYNIKTGVVAPLLVSYINSQTDILNFSLDYPIPSVVLLYTTEEDGDILHWIDRLNRPMKLNLLDAVNNIYGTNWIEEYLTVARPTPPLPPICSYANDNSVTINNLRRKLYQFRYRFVYRDNTKSTWSSYSKLFTPTNPDNLATEVDPTKNNRIDVMVRTGSADCVKIEISARQSVVDTFSDCFLVQILDKQELGLEDNTIYTYNFFNDSAYPPVDIAENNLLWSNVPQSANALELLNGNVIVYGATTEGYNFDEILDIDKSIELIDNSAVISLFYNVSYGFNWNTGLGTTERGTLISFTGLLDTISTVRIVMTYGYLSQIFTYTSTYTYIPGDTIQDMITFFKNDINANTIFFTARDKTNNNIYNTIPDDSIVIFARNNPTIFPGVSLTLTAAISPGSGSDVNIAMFHHLSRYRAGLVYFDDFDETNGVQTDATLFLETPEVNTTGQTQMNIPQITLSINSQPPIWAKKFSWVFTNSLTYGTTLTTVSANTDKDTNFGYLDITNQETNQNNYPVYDFSSGDRVRIIGKFGSAVNLVDVPIVDLVLNPNINGVNKTGSWLKVPYDSSKMSTYGTDKNWNIEIYTPTLNTQSDLQVFYEVGEQYPVLNAGTSTRAHGGQTQDQIVATQPAIFVFTRGDFYIRTRVLPLNADLTNTNTVWITDQSVSDLYPSKVKNNGRAYVIDKSVVNSFFMTRLRWGQSYQQNTNINQTNIFYPLNLDEIDRGKGAIQRFKVRDRILRVFQNRGVGQFGIYARYIQNNNGVGQLVTTDDILTANNINYYLGEYGMGEQYCSLVCSKNQDYFKDPVRGYDIRVSNDGITPISMLNKGQYFIQPLFPPYNKPYLRSNGSKAKIIGAYNYFEEQCINVLQGGALNGDTIQPYAFSWNEKRNSYDVFYDFQPEWIMSAEDKIYSWKNGVLYAHDDTENYCKFYGTQYYPSITLVFNDKIAVKKTFESLAYQANQFWVAPTNGDILTSQPNEQTGLDQISQLKAVDFTINEGLYYAALLRDANSMADARNALINGDYLKGVWCQVKLTYIGNEFAYLYLPYIGYSLSPKNL